MARGIQIWTTDRGWGRLALLGAPIAASSLGDNEIVAGVPGKQIVVIAVLLVASAAVTVKFRSAATDITGPMAFLANGGFSAEVRDGLFETNTGEALNLNLSAAESVGGCLTYVEL